MYRIIVAVVVVILMGFSGAMAAEVKVIWKAVPELGWCNLSVHGAIDHQTPGQIDRMLAQHRCKNKIDVWLDSEGGDVNAAMECGRIIRRVQATTEIMHETDRCASACVLMFLGGVGRNGYGQIGLHRPFSTAISSSTVESQRSFDGLNQKVKQYLIEMNIPTRLLDIMNSVSPSTIKWLSMISDRNELEELLVIGADPAFADASASSSAKLIGISKKELYRRYQEADKVCGSVDWLARMTAEEYMNVGQCRSNIIFGKDFPHK